MNTLGYKVRPSSTGGWTTYLDLGPDLPEDEILTRLSIASGQPPELCRTIAAEFIRQLIAAAGEGRACPNLFDLLRSEPTSGGSADTPDGFHTRADLRLDLRLALLPAARAALGKDGPIEKRGQQGTKTPVIATILCLANDQADVYQAGHFIDLHGADLKHDRNDPEQGVFLTPVAGGPTVRCSVYARLTKGRTVPLVPEGTTGPQRVEVRVKIENSLRAFVYGTDLQPL